MRGTAVCRHTVLACAPLQGTKPRALCLKHRTVRSFSLPVLPVVESFPGAMSPLGSKESNFLSYLIGSLFHQDHRDAHTELSRHRNDGHSRSQVARMGPAHRAEKLSQLPVLTDRRPGGLDELTSKPPVSRVGDRSSIGSLSGRVLGRHQAEKPSQLTNIFKLSPIPDASHKLT